MKFTRTIETQVTVDIPFEFMRYGDVDDSWRSYYAVCGDDILKISRTHLSFNIIPSQFDIEHSTECSREEVLMAFDEFVTTVKTALSDRRSCQDTSWQLRPDAS